MIRNFGDARTVALYEGNVPSGLAADVARRATMRLQMIDAADRVEALHVPPSNRLKKLKGNLADWWSLRVNDQYRIIFRWVDGAAEGVEFIDYHD